MGLPGSTSIVTRLLPLSQICTTRASPTIKRIPLAQLPGHPEKTPECSIFVPQPANQDHNEGKSRQLLSFNWETIQTVLNLMISFPQQLVLIFTFQIQLVTSKFIIRITTP